MFCIAAISCIGPEQNMEILIAVDYLVLILATCAVRFALHVRTRAALAARS